MRRSRSNTLFRPRSSSGTILPVDNLATWSNSELLVTASLPGVSTTRYMLVVDATKALSTTAASSGQAGSLRFVTEDGIRLGHYRTATGRILVGGMFNSGVNRITAYWGKSGAVQPGSGFPNAASVMAPFRLFLIFENGAPVDLSSTPATFTTVGTPTYVDALNGQGLQCSIGSYIQTVSSKVRADARTNRSDFVVARTSGDGADSRLICWADWGSASQRAYQLWLRDVAELYVSENAAGPYNRWVLPSLPRAGWNAVGCKWKGGENLAYILLNDEAIEVGRDFQSFLPVQLADANTPYIVGGSPVPGNGFNGVIDCQMSLFGDFTSLEQMLAWKIAWSKNDVFWNTADYTPDNFDVPTLTNQALNTEVAFAKITITGITQNVPISVSSDSGGSPTYAIGSSMDSTSNIKAKGSTNGTISAGNVLSTWHLTSNTNSTVTETNVTIGTVTSKRISSTASATPGGGTPTPGGPATYTVNSASALVAAFNTAKGGEIIEIVPGDYTSEGQIKLQNRDFRGGSPLVIRSGTLPWRGYLPSQGGLVVANESNFTTGSGGSEFRSLYVRNVHNVEFTGLRTYNGQTTALVRGLDCIGCSYLTFTNMKFCGYKPTTPKYLWAPDKYRDTGWSKSQAGVQCGINGACQNMTFRKCLFHWFGGIAYFNANAANTLIEDCVLVDQMVDQMTTNGMQENFTARGCIFFRTWTDRNSTGGISHTDHVQNTSKDQAGWKNHTFENCIFAPGDSTYPHVQVLFYEHDNYPTYPRGSGLFVRNCLIESRVTNTIYSRPGDNVNVIDTTIIQNQFGGIPDMNEDGTSDLIDRTWWSPAILVAATTQNGLSLGNNKIDNSVYYTTDLRTDLGDQILNSTQFQKTSYAAQLFDYPLFQEGLYRPVILFDSKYVLSVSELKRMAPKTSSSIHPNQMGRHHGASQLLQTLGALP